MHDYDWLWLIMIDYACHSHRSSKSHEIANVPAQGLSCIQAFHGPPCRKFSSPAVLGSERPLISPLLLTTWCDTGKNNPKVWKILKNAESMKSAQSLCRPAFSKASSSFFLGAAELLWNWQVLKSPYIDKVCEGSNSWTYLGRTCSQFGPSILHNLVPLKSPFVPRIWNAWTDWPFCALTDGCDRVLCEPKRSMASEPGCSLECIFKPVVLSSILA